MTATRLLGWLCLLPVVWVIGMLVTGRVTESAVARWTRNPTPDLPWPEKVMLWAAWPAVLVVVLVGAVARVAFRLVARVTGRGR